MSNLNEISALSEVTTGFHRPVGITILGTINIIGGIFLMVLGFSVLAESPFVFWLFFVLGAFTIVVSLGLLGLKSWARVCAIIGYLLNFFTSLVSLPDSLFALIISSLILIYFFTDNVKRVFTASSGLS